VFKKNRQHQKRQKFNYSNKQYTRVARMFIPGKVGGGGGRGRWKSCFHDDGSEGKPASCPCKMATRATSLWTAVQYGDYDEVIRRVHLNSSLVNAQDKYGYTALHYAAQGGHVSIVIFLLSKGANPNADSCGATPLVRAGILSLMLCKCVFECLP